MIIPSAPADRQYIYAIDGPGRLHTRAGLLQLTGWIAGWPDASVQVRLQLGPDSLFDCTTGEVRPDVAAAHPDLPGAAQSGFRLETYVPAGFHIGTLQYRLAGRT